MTESDIRVRKIGIDELRSVITFTSLFTEESEFINCDVEHTVSTYTRLMKNGSMNVIVLEKNDELIGSLAFLVAPDLHDGKLTAVETFWFVHPDHRGHGVMLFNEYEKISIRKGCRKLAMIHMVDSYPDRLEAFYKRRGYDLIEKHYVKEI